MATKPLAPVTNTGDESLVDIQPSYEFSRKPKTLRWSRGNAIPSKQRKEGVTGARGPAQEKSSRQRHPMLEEERAFSRARRLTCRARLGPTSSAT
jgi:hypothetical protein